MDAAEEVDLDSLKQARKELPMLAKFARKLHEVELEHIRMYAYAPWRVVWVNFLAGTARGLGFLIGATLVMAATTYIVVNILSEIPGVGKFFQEIPELLEYAKSIRR